MKYSNTRQIQKHFKIVKNKTLVTELSFTSLSIKNTRNLKSKTEN